MKLFQKSYEASSKDDPIRRKPLSIHARPNRENDQIVVFIHGLNGERYLTWGDLPAEMFTQFPHADFGFYGYRNGFQRWNPFKSISLEDEAQVLIDTLRDSPYKTIVLMGHSLGGVLIRVAITKMIEMNNLGLLKRIKAMFLYAVPQQGAHSLPALLNLMNSDASALSRNSDLIKRTTRVFLDNFHTNEKKPVDADGLWLPVYCIQAVEDLWVKELSAAINIKTSMRKVVRESHTSVVKGNNSEVGDWVISKLRLYLSPATPDKPAPRKMIRHGPTTSI